jgi:hypothetical protein
MKNRTLKHSFLAGLAVSTLALTAAMPTSSHAGLFGSFLGGGLGMATGFDPNAAKDSSVKEQTKTIEELTKTLEELTKLQTGQLSGNIMSTLSGQANMNQLADERERQRAIEGERFDAIKKTATTQQSCVIRTRVKYDSTFNRSDERLNAATLFSLEQLAAWREGASVGGSGDPIETTSEEQKMEIWANQIDTDAHSAVRNILSGDNFVSADIGESCNQFAMLASTKPGQDVSNFDNASDTDSASRKVDAYGYLAKSSLSDAVMRQYCADRNPLENQGDPSIEKIKSAAKNIPGYENETFPNGISFAMSLQIRAQEWIPVVTSEGNSETTNIDLMTKMLAWQTFQNHELYKKVDKLTLLQAAELAATTEMLQFQKEQARKSE